MQQTILAAATSMAAAGPANATHQTCWIWRLQDYSSWHAAAVKEVPAQQAAADVLHAQRKLRHNHEGGQRAASQHILFSEYPSITSQVTRQSTQRHNNKLTATESQNRGGSRRAAAAAVAHAKLQPHEG